MKILAQVKDAIRNPFIWPGGYPIYVVMSDGALLCRKCAKENYQYIVDSTNHDYDDGWKAEGATILYEGLEYCGHCGERLESAYE